MRGPVCYHYNYKVHLFTFIDPDTTFTMIRRKYLKENEYDISSLSLVIEEKEKDDTNIS